MVVSKNIVVVSSFVVGMVEALRMDAEAGQLTPEQKHMARKVTQGVIDKQKRSVLSSQFEKKRWWPCCCLNKLDKKVYVRLVRRFVTLKGSKGTPVVDLIMKYCREDSTNFEKIASAVEWAVLKDRRFFRTERPDLSDVDPNVERDYEKYTYYSADDMPAEDKLGDIAIKIVDSACLKLETAMENLSCEQEVLDFLTSSSVVHAHSHCRFVKNESDGKFGIIADVGEEFGYHCTGRSFPVVCVTNVLLKRFLASKNLIAAGELLMHWRELPVKYDLRLDVAGTKMLKDDDSYRRMIDDDDDDDDDDDLSILSGENLDLPSFSDLDADDSWKPFEQLQKQLIQHLSAKLDLGNPTQFDDAILKKLVEQARIQRQQAMI